MGAAIRRARRRLELSQEDLAEKIGVTRRTLGEWERTDKVPTKHLPRLLEVLGPDALDGVAAEQPGTPALNSSAAEMITIARGDLVVTISPGQMAGATPASVLERMDQLAEIVARRLRELAAEEEE